MRRLLPPFRLILAEARDEICACHTQRANNHDHSWWRGDLPNRNVRYASIDQHPKRCSQKGGPKSGTQHFGKHKGWFDTILLSLKGDQTWNAIPSRGTTRKMGQAAIPAARKGGHKYIERCEGDRECARNDEIGQIGGYENRRT